MTAATMQQTPVIPPRPSRSQDNDTAASAPKIPPRPAKRLNDRSVSPNPSRFAPSPLIDGIPLKSPKALRFSDDNGSDESIDRPGSVAMPSLGEEGREYSVVTEEYEGEKQPEKTSTVADDLKLHAPKPSLSAQNAKQRVQTVTRTDSDKAASFGIGRPTSSQGMKKRSSASFSTTESQSDTEEGHGIPEIGQRVPMNPHLGDVQAPSPAPGSEEFRHHHRKTSSRGGPPGSYGLHGHGVAPQDKLDKEYYDKNPHVYDRENKTPLHDRQNDYAMSSNDLNKLVRDTPSRAAQHSSDYQSVPSDEVGFQASEEYASRISSPRPTSGSDDKLRAPSFKSEVTGPDGEKTVHVDEPERPSYRSPGDNETAIDDDEHEYTAPILASDEVSKDQKAYVQQPAVHPPPERRGSANEMEDPPSRPTSRPTSIYKENSQEFASTPLEDVKEYEPLFSEEEKKEEKKNGEGKARHYFPSKDVWEDAPNSVHYTAEVSTPDVTEKTRTLSSGVEDAPKTPAHLFAKRQEELAELEVQGPADVKSTVSKEKPIWTQSQPESESFLAPKRPAHVQRFPSRDVWEDVPESQLYEATVSSEQQEETQQEESKPEIPARPVKKPSDATEKPAIPERPKPKQTPSDEGLKPRPVVSDKPKPQIPPRPARGSTGEGEAPKSKPPVPSRPVGGKIAALQAGFMSDLNKRLQLGPQAPKKEEPKPQEDLTEEKEKAPLSDARKGRARGPQRRAPAKSPAAPEPAKSTGPTLSFSMPQTFWSVDPDNGSLAVTGEEAPVPVVEEVEKVEEEKVEEEKMEEKMEEKTEQVEEAQTVEDAPEDAKVELSEESKPAEDKVEAPDKEEAEEKPLETSVEPVSEEVKA